jgi:hypothetical protein
MNRKSIIAFALTGALVTTVTVLADVDFDGATGIGFVGKGDLQSADAFGWNNAEAQVNIPYVTYTVEAVHTEKQGCHPTGEPPSTANLVGYRHHSQTGTGVVLSELRIHQQIDGIYLIGYGPDGIVYGDFDDPVGDNGETAGNACPGFPGTHPAFGWIDEGTVITGLFATFNGTTVKIWPEE